MIDLVPGRQLELEKTKFKKIKRGWASCSAHPPVYINANKVVSLLTVGHEEVCPDAVKPDLKRGYSRCVIPGHLTRSCPNSWLRWGEVAGGGGEV